VAAAMRPLAVSTAVLHLLTYAQLLSGTRRLYCYDATAPQRGFMSRPTGGVEAACKERYCCNQYCCIAPPQPATGASYLFIYLQQIIEVINKYGAASARRPAPFAMLRRSC